MEGGSDPGGVAGGGSDVMTGNVDDGMEGGADPGGSTGGQPRPEDFIK
jgi:hypothetical protein